MSGHTTLKVKSTPQSFILIFYTTLVSTNNFFKFLSFSNTTEMLVKDASFINLFDLHDILEK